MADDSQDDADEAGIDAEAWLAERGVERDPIRVRPDVPRGKSDEPPPPRPPERQPPRPRPPGEPAPRVAGEEPAHEEPAHEEPAHEEPAGDEPGGVGGAEGLPTSGAPQLDDAVAEAAAYVRRATAKTPMSEGRLRRRLAEREHPEPVVEQTLRRCREQGIVDDRSFAAALVEEGRRKGHAPLRIRKDLERREFSAEVVGEALATIADRDPGSAAFAVARRRAEQLRGVDAETAFRRLVSYVARRGYTEGLARKVARQAVFDDREAERTAER